MSTPSRRRLRINIVGLDNGAGLTVDARIVLGVLQGAGFDATWFKGVRPAKWKSRVARTPLGALLAHYDMNLFLERIHPGWYPFARLNVLLPNPEWFRDDLHAHLQGIDHVLCKTRDAQRAFDALGMRTAQVGFTAEDHGAAGRLVADSQPVMALHVAGRSEHKGTRAVIDCWARHPEWPRLTVVQRPLDRDSVLYAPPLPNVRYFKERVSDEALRAMQHEHAVQVLPSEVEGYGQALVEGLSLGAVVVTTDAPPMNELVSAAHGVLVAAGPGEAFRLGHRYPVIPDQLEQALARVFAWSPQQRHDVGAAARAWFLDNDWRFRSEFVRVVETLLTSSLPGAPRIRGASTP
jgi:glycosyltransferase involved in cell wall biosynthesis